MARGSKHLDNYEYDDYLAKTGRTRELARRKAERRDANKGYKGWHFGIDTKPVYTRDKDEYKRALEKRGLMMRDDVRKNLK